MTLLERCKHVLQRNDTIITIFDDSGHPHWVRNYREGRDESIAVGLAATIEAVYQHCYFDPEDCPRKRAVLEAGFLAFVESANNGQNLSQRR